MATPERLQEMLDNAQQMMDEVMASGDEYLPELKTALDRQIAVLTQSLESHESFRSYGLQQHWAMQPTQEG